MKLYFKQLCNRNNIVQNIYQFIKFGIVGFSNTIISLLVYYLLIANNINYIISNTIGFLISVINAFYWNNKYVFTDKTETNVKKAFIKVVITYGGSFVLSTVLIYIMVDIINVSEWIAPILRLIVTVPLNFLVNKLWAFRK